jgi:hypothetical protein
MKTNKKIQIEKIIDEQLTREGRTVTWLCLQMRWKRQKWYRFKNNGLIEVQDLFNISVLLNHNFFQYYTDKFISVTK